MNRLSPAPHGILSPSILAADFSKLKQEIESVEKAGVDWIHVDVMDGHFVPNLTMGPAIVKSLKAVTRLPLDCHLMVTDPARWITPFAESGAQIITVHVEAAGRELPGLLDQIRKKGCNPGVSLNPETPVSAVEGVLDQVDLVLVMSVNPGFTGQKFMDSSFDKIKRLKEIRQGRKYLIEVDGGVGKANAAALRQAGADALVAGAAVFFSPDRALAVKELRKLMNP